MSLDNAFHLLLNLHSRQVSLERPGKEAISIKITPSNYFRNLSAPEEIIVEGREFIVTKRSLDAQSFGPPKRGDRITDSDLGLSVITEVREIFAFGGEIIGYRLRTS